MCDKKLPLPCDSRVDVLSMLRLVFPALEAFLGKLQQIAFSIDVWVAVDWKYPRWIWDYMSVRTHWFDLGMRMDHT